MNTVTIAQIHETISNDNYAYNTYYNYCADNCIDSAVDQNTLETAFQMEDGAIMFTPSGDSGSTQIMFENDFDHYKLQCVMIVMNKFLK